LNRRNEKGKESILTIFFEIMVEHLGEERENHRKADHIKKDGQENHSESTPVGLVGCRGTCTHFESQDS
jgi:hypothetical protein